jgi:hypothetical protein
MLNRSIIKFITFTLTILNVHIPFAGTLYSKSIIVDRKDVDYCVSDTLSYRIRITEKWAYDLEILSHFVRLTNKKGFVLPSIYNDHESSSIGVYKVKNVSDSIKEIVVNFFPLKSDSSFRATRLKRWNDSLSKMSFAEHMDFFWNTQDSVTIDNELPYLSTKTFYLVVNIAFEKNYKTMSKVRDEIFFLDSITINCP